jgi:hypothetical protein
VSRVLGPDTPLSAATSSMANPAGRPRYSRFDGGVAELRHDVVEYLVRSQYAPPSQIKQHPAFCRSNPSAAVDLRDLEPFMFHVCDVTKLVEPIALVVTFWKATMLATKHKFLFAFPPKVACPQAPVENLALTEG